MSLGPEVRPARLADCEQVLQLWDLLWEDANGPDRGWREAAGAWLSANIDEPTSRIVVVEVDGALAASAVGCDKH